MQPQRPGATRDNFIPMLAVLVLLAGWILLEGEHYTLFHSLIELFTAAIGLTIFSTAWHTRRVSSSAYMTFLGMWAFSTAWITVIHALTYKGVELLPGYGSNLPTQLWVIARSLQTVAFLMAPLYFTRPLKRPALVLAGFGGTGVALVVAALVGWFPDAFVEGQGLTPFKIWAEYAFMGGTTLGAIGLIWHREHLERRAFHLLLASMGFSVVAEFAFTLYNDPTGPANRFGHTAYLGAFVLLYLALVRTSLEMPYSSLFRALKKREEELSHAYAIEHDIAETLQSAMAVQPAGGPGLDISHRYLPALGIGRIGGDFYDLFPLPDSRVAIVIGDVCGKGLKAAASALKARTAMRAMALQHADPAEVLERVNIYLYRELEDDSFITAAYGVIDTETGTLEMALAGHVDPLVCGSDRSPFDGIRTPPLGVCERLGATSRTITFKPGDSLVLVTDGVIDAPGPDGRFGENRLTGLVRDLSCPESADEVLATLIGALSEHSGDAINDDVAVVVVRWAPEAA